MVKPSSLGRRTRMTATPQRWAASSFSGKPPAAPPSLVIMERMWYRSMAAILVSRENGPLPAKMWSSSRPALWQSLRDDSKGSTRA